MVAERRPGRIPATLPARYSSMVSEPIADKLVEVDDDSGGGFRHLRSKLGSRGPIEGDFKRQADSRRSTVYDDSLGEVIDLRFDSFEEKMDHHHRELMDLLENLCRGNHTPTRSEWMIADECAPPSSPRRTPAVWKNSQVSISNPTQMHSKNSRKGYSNDPVRLQNTRTQVPRLDLSSTSRRLVDSNGFHSDAQEFGCQSRGDSWLRVESRSVDWRKGGRQIHRKKDSMVLNYIRPHRLKRKLMLDDEEAEKNPLKFRIVGQGGWNDVGGVEFVFVRDEYELFDAMPVGVEYESGVAFGYIHKDLRLGSKEIDRLRGADLKKLNSAKKLILILDLDHTLLNSTRLAEISPEEEHLKHQAQSMQADPDRSIFELPGMHLLTKLRPFVRTFLQEASKMFELYVYTMAERAYALEIAKILDPEKFYFGTRVISQSDSTKRHQKGLDVVLGAESVVVILDDTEFVWPRHKENLILMERYHFFASSCRLFGSNARSLSEMKKDECESDGALSIILNVLKRVHQMFYDPDLRTEFSSRDVRQVLKHIRQEILQGCKIVFSRVFPLKAHADDQPIWKMAQQLGAVCSIEVDASVTHVVSTDKNTEKARWALKNEKFLVTPHWIEAANYLWRRQKEEDFQIANSSKNPPA